MTAISTSPIVQRNSVQLAIGEKGKIVGFSRQDIAANLMAMGVLPGSELRLIRQAPFGGAYYLAVDHHYLALRKNEFEAIVIRK